MLEIHSPFDPDTGKDCWHIVLWTRAWGRLVIPVHRVTREHAEEHAEQLAEVFDLDFWRPPLWEIHPFDWIHVAPVRQRPDPRRDPRRCPS